ncbi:XRI1 protein [Spatholobus suberectus]|nr:XRI1 protein [Spatholobus suberectus]
MELDIGVTHSDLTLAESWFASDTSTGYLEDAIAGWGIWCKQHNFPSYSQDQKVNYKSQYLVDHEDIFPAFSSATQILHDHKNFSTGNLSSSQNDTHAAAAKNDSSQRSYASRESDESDASVSRGHWKKIAYPFELVKPGGVEGETTLKDINHQMLMSPSKPIPHLVGDPLTQSCISTRAFGISGKAVAALTRIHTQGRGSITIIRTKG